MVNNFKNIIKDVIDSCPCEQETPENLNLRININTLIITVHGTGAKHAKWTYSGNLVDSLLKEKPNVQLSRFCWSGGNSHSKRLKAGNELAEHVKKISKEYPKIKFILIGHSHGGNVIMYALKKLSNNNEINNIKKIVTLATPFLYIKLKKLNPQILFGSFLLFLICILELKFGGWKLNTNFFTSIMASFFCFFQLLLLFSIILNKNGFRLFKKYLLLIRTNNNISIFQNEINNFDLNPTKSNSSYKPKYLIVRPVGDEASMALSVSQFLSWANIFTLKIFSNIANNSFNYLFKVIKEYYFSIINFCSIGLFYKKYKHPSSEKISQDRQVIFKPMSRQELSIAIIKFQFFSVLISYLIFPFLFPNLFKYMSNLIPVFIDLFDNILVVIFLIVIFSILFFLGAIFWLLGIISIICLLFLTLSSLAFGFDAVFWSLFTQTTVESTPPGLYDVYVHPSQGEKINNKKLDLEHSLIYNDDKVLKMINDWLLED